jgi:hypothetical protein
MGGRTLKLFNRYVRKYVRKGRGFELKELTEKEQKDLEKLPENQDEIEAKVKSFLKEMQNVASISEIEVVLMIDYKVRVGIVFQYFGEPLELKRYWSDNRFTRYLLYGGAKD